MATFNDGKAGLAKEEWLGIFQKNNDLIINKIRNNGEKG